MTPPGRPACTEESVDPAVFFPDTPEQLAAARAVCGGCPCGRSCLDAALAAGTSDGVWGGVLLQRGTPVLVKRRPGRPRSSRAA